MPLSPSISVIVTTFNRDDYLAQALTSLRDQTPPLQEVVVVDDGGSGHARDVVERFGPTFRYVRQPNSGQQAARNLGMQHLTGEWLTYLDDDDVWMRNRHASLLAAVQTDAADAWFSDCVRFLGAEELPGTLFGDFSRARPTYFEGHAPVNAEQALLGKFALANLIPVSPFWAGSMLLIRRSLALSIGGWDTRLRGVKSEDIEFTYRVFRHARTGVLWEPTVRCRCRDGTDSASEFEVAKGRAAVWQYILGQPGTPSLDRAMISQCLQPVYRDLFWLAYQRGEHAYANQAYGWMAPQTRTFTNRVRMAWLEVRAWLN